MKIVEFIVQSLTIDHNIYMIYFLEFYGTVRKELE